MSRKITRPLRFRIGQTNDSARSAIEAKRGLRLIRTQKLERKQKCDRCNGSGIMPCPSCPKPKMKAGHDPWPPDSVADANDLLYGPPEPKCARCEGEKEIECPHCWRVQWRLSDKRKLIFERTRGPGGRGALCYRIVKIVERGERRANENSSA